MSNAGRRTARLALTATGLALGLGTACEEDPGPRVNCNLEELPPTVTFVSPEAGATLSGTVPLVVNASDNCYITAVRFTFGDGSLIGTLTNWIDQPGPGTFTFRLDWDSRAVPDGPVTVTAWAEDARIASDGDPTPNPNTGSESRQFTIVNP